MDLSDNSKKLTNPQPFRLVMIKNFDNCQFCSEPKGEVYIHYVSPIDMIGFVSCIKCSDLARKAADEWSDNCAYGQANILKNKKIKIRRSSGVIDDDWELSKSSTLVHSIDNEDCVSCIKQGASIVKMVKISELLELNNN